MRPVGCLLVTFLALGVAAGCGSSKTLTTSTPFQTEQGSDTGPHRAAGTGHTAQVTMQSIAFAPTTVRVHVGDTIRWSNRDSVDHNVTTTTGATLRSGDIRPGASYQTTVDQATTIEYVCTIHAAAMTGRIVVTR